MKFKCHNCVDEGLDNHPCVLQIKGIKKDNDREDWKIALRRCPFENTITDYQGEHFTGEIPLANWKQVKK